MAFDPSTGSGRSGGRWGGKASGHAGMRDFPRLARDDEFLGRQGVGRPPHSMTEAASGRNDNLVQGYDGSRFELRYIAVESQPWHVVDSDGAVKKFTTQEDAENYILAENRKALLEETDDRDLHYRKKPKET